MFVSKNYVLILMTLTAFFVESGNAFVEVGEVFQKSEEKFRCVGGTDSIRLENDNQWLEVTEETLNEYFKPQ